MGARPSWISARCWPSGRAIAATSLRSRPLAEKAEIVRGVRDEVWPLVEAGRIRPIMDRRLPMTEAAQAHRLVESSDHFGKVLLTRSRVSSGLGRQLSEPASVG